MLAALCALAIVAAWQLREAAAAPARCRIMTPCASCSG